MREKAILNIDLNQFEAEVIDASRHTPILVDFWAEWCSPCLVLAPVLERVLADYTGRVRLTKVEVDEGENMKLAGRYGIRGFPTVLLFVDGSEVERFTSARPDAFVRQFLDRHL